MAEKHAQSLDVASRAAKLEHRAASLVYQGLDTAISLSCWILLKNGEHDQLVSKRINPEDYNCPQKFADDYMAVSLLSKSQLVSTSFDKEARARESYLASEELCRDTNERLCLFRDEAVSPLDQRVVTTIKRAQQLVPKILRKLDPKTLSQIEKEMSFGPGATVGVKRVVTSGRKFDLPNIDCTPEVLSFGIHCLPPLWKQRVTGFNPVTCAELEFVPKNSKTFRAIEIQPTLNIYIQKGFGSVIRQRLAAFGLDLSTQERNQEGARLASLDAGYTTLDLSSASDTISHGTVRLLFEKAPDWLEALEWARVGRCLDRKTKNQISLEKFSAMGNGYTFELESLIFYALSLASREVAGNCDTRMPLVYGDDMIIDNDSCVLLLMTLNFLGFNVNADKTFGKTYFRESCGADFFDGLNVRPVFFKRKPDDKQDIIELCYIYANQLLRYSTHRTGGYFRDRRFFAAWRFLFCEVPARFRFRVPTDFESGGFLGSFDECCPTLKRASAGWQGYHFRYSSRTQRVSTRYAIGALTASLHSPTLFSYGEESLRGGANRLSATTRVGYALAWPDLGPWV